MKQLLMASLVLLLYPGKAGAQRYSIHNAGQASRVEVTTDIGHYKATNTLKEGMLDASAGTIRCRIAVQDFDFGPIRVFQASTTIGRFLKAYMETGKYPDITYAGRITDLKEIDFTKDGTYEAKTEGTLTAHGVRKKIMIPVTFTVKNGTVAVESVFHLKPADDYKVRADTPAKYTYFNAVTVRLHAILIKS